MLPERSLVGHAQFLHHATQTWIASVLFGVDAIEVQFVEAAAMI